MQVKMLRTTKWLKKELKLEKGEVLDVDQATASRWVALRIAEFPKDGSISIGKDVYTETEIKKMTIENLYALAEQYGIEIKLGTPKVAIIKKINKYLNPDVPEQEDKKSEKVCNDFTIVDKSTLTINSDSSIPMSDVEDNKEDIDGDFNS